MGATDISQIVGGANEVLALVLAAVGIIVVLLKVWNSQKAAVIKAHEAAKVIDRVAAEFQNNHGSSMKDAIDRLESGQVDQANQIQAAREQMAELHKSQVDLIRRVDDSYRLFANVVASDVQPHRRAGDPTDTYHARGVEEV